MGSREPSDRRCVPARLRRAQAASFSAHAPRSSRWRSLRTIAATALLVWAWAAAATTYLYDANGRLVVVTNDAGESARYVYDAMGNVGRIDRIAATDLAVFTFAPGRGGTGREVKIRGRGFAATPGANQVSFNGTVATVLEASATELRAVVPAGASTGPIAVVAAGRSAASVQNFVVDENTHAPVVTGIAPLAVTAGDTIAVSGQRLMPVAGQTTFKLNGRPVSPDSLSDAQATLRIPTGASSGKIAVATPYGIGVGAQTVLVVPPYVAAASVVDVKDLAVDGAAGAYSVPAAQQYGAAIFQGAAGDYLSAQFSAMPAGLRLRYSLYNQANQTLASGSVSADYPSVHLPRLKAGGTYLLLMQTEAASATWSMALERAKPLALDGAASPVDTVVAGQQRRFVFDAAAGTAMGFALYDRATPVAWGTATVSVYDPEGVQLAQQFCDQVRKGCAINLSGLAAGTHTLVVTPATTGNRLLGMDASLSGDLRGALVRDVPAALVLDRRGQNARRSFAGNAGELLALQVSGQTTAPAAALVYYRVLGPNGATIASTGVRVGATLQLALPATGAYEVFVDPEYGETLTAQMLLSSGASAMQADGNSAVFETTAPGQGVYASFQAGAGQNLGLGLSELTVSGGGYVNATVYKPDGTVAAASTCFVANDGCDFNLANLAAGTYGLAVRPMDDVQTLRFKATLSADAAMTLAPGSSLAMNLARRGQNGRVAFDGSAGQVLKFEVSAQQTLPAGRVVYYRVQRANGIVIGAMGVSAGKSTTLELPGTETYTVYADPEFGATATAQLGLSPGSFGAAVLDGDTGQYQTTTPGQSVTIEFNPGSGQFVGFGLTDLVSSDGQYVSAYAYTPGSSSSSNYADCQVGTGCELDVNRTVSGTYRIVVKPSSASQTFKFKATLSTSLGGTLAPDTPRTVAIERPGQNGRLGFDGVAGQTFGLMITGQTTTPANVGVLYEIWAEDGNSANPVATGVVDSSASLYVAIPTTKRYVLWIDPKRGAMPTARVLLTSGKEARVVADGPSTGAETVLPGDSIYFTVDGSPNTGMGLALTELVSTGNQPVYVNILSAPVSMWPASHTCYPHKDCSIDLPQASGQYRFMIRPDSYEQLMKFKLTLSSDVKLSLRRDEAVDLNLPRRGQNAYLSFTGQAGERLGFSVSGQVTQPVGKEAVYTVLKPGGGTVHVQDNTSALTGTTQHLILPSTGTYTVFVNPIEGAALRARAKLSTGTAEGLVPDGPPVHFETTLPGQGIYLTASSVETALTFRVRNLALSSGTEFKIRAYWPTSSAYETVTCKLANGGCDVNLPKTASGRWGLVLSPEDPERAIQFDGTLVRVPAAARAAP